jgi:thioredoxin 1
MSEVLYVDSASWEAEVLKSDVPVLVDFGAAWCGPCQVIGPVLDELAAEADGKFKIAKVDVDKSQDLAAQFGVRSIPMLLVMVNGEVKEQAIGVKKKDELKSMVTKFA